MNTIGTFLLKRLDLKNLEMIFLLTIKTLPNKKDFIIKRLQFWEYRICNEKMNSLFEMRSPLILNMRMEKQDWLKPYLNIQRVFRILNYFGRMIWNTQSIPLKERLRVRVLGKWGTALFMFLDATIPTLSFAKCKVIGDKKKC